MNIEKHIDELIAWIKIVAKEVGQTAREQAPLVVVEYVRWMAWVNIFRVLVPVLFLIPSLIVFIVSLHNISFHDGDIHGGAISQVFFVIFGLAMIASAIGLCVTLCEYAPLAIKALIAPRVVILEEINKLVRNR